MPQTFHGGRMSAQKKSTKSWISGHINWYDPSSGKGSIIGDDGVWYRIHEFSEIRSLKQKALKAKTRVEFILANDSIHPIIKCIRECDVRVAKSKTSEIPMPREFPKVREA